MKSLAIVLVILVVGGLVGFTVINSERKVDTERVLFDEFVPVTVKENTVNTSFVKFIDRGMMKASWYGPRFHGKLTANGEIYDQMALTAAHKSLRFGTLLKITNTKNGKSVIVRINDRGPYIAGRQLDLSKGAAIELGILEKGVAKVKVEEVTLTGDNAPRVMIN